MMLFSLFLGPPSKGKKTSTCQFSETKTIEFIYTMLAHSNINHSLLNTLKYRLFPPPFVSRPCRREKNRKTETLKTL